MNALDESTSVYISMEKYAFKVILCTFHSKRHGVRGIYNVMYISAWNELIHVARPFSIVAIYWGTRSNVRYCLVSNMIGLAHTCTSGKLIVCSLLRLC